MQEALMIITLTIGSYNGNASSIDSNIVPMATCREVQTKRPKIIQSYGKVVYDVSCTPIPTKQ